MKYLKNSKDLNWFEMIGVILICLLLIIFVLLLAWVSMVATVNLLK